MKIKKRIILVAAIIACFCFNSVYAKDENIKVFLDNKQIKFDVEPVIEKGRTLVPLSTIFEVLGVKLDWDGNGQAVTGTRGNKVISLKIGERIARVDNYSVILDVPPCIINGRTLVPLQFISEALGTLVKWDRATRTVEITSKLNAIPLSQADFETTYKNVILKVGISPEELFDKFGYGTEEDDDRVDSSGYKSQLHIYSDNNTNSKININVKVNESTKDKFISVIDVTDYGTKREIKKNCSRDDLVKAYGEPSSRTGTFGQGWVYNYGDTKLQFIFAVDKIDAIFIFGKWGLD
jgi:hypothetical protein